MLIVLSTCSLGGYLALGCRGCLCSHFLVTWDVSLDGS